MPRIARDRIRTNRKTGRRSVVVTLGALPRLPPRIRRPKWTHRSWLIPLGHIEREAYDYINSRAAEAPGLLMATSVAQLAEYLLINRTRAHRLILRVSDKGWIRPTDRHRTRWIPTMKAWLCIHIGEIEQVFSLAAEAMETGNKAMQEHATAILASLVRMLPAKHRCNGTMVWPSDFGPLMPASSPSVQRAGTDSTVRQSVTDPPDAIVPAD